MKSTLYLALLRGINVGGKNIIKMSALKECFEQMGLRDVTTFIQSGNVIFRSPKSDVVALVHMIEEALTRYFGVSLHIVLISFNQLEEIVQNAPEEFGNDPTRYRSDVVFIREPLAAEEAIKSVRTREGVDTALAGKQVIYFTRLISRAPQSFLSKIIQLPIYKDLTIRNWNTTTKLRAIMKMME